MYYFQIDRKGQQSLGFIVNQSPNTQKAAQGRWSLDCISLTCTADERPQKAAVLLRGNTTHWEKLGKTRADRYKAWLSWTFPFYFKVSYSQGVTGKKLGSFQQLLFSEYCIPREPYNYSEKYMQEKVEWTNCLGHGYSGNIQNVSLHTSCHVHIHPH
jgi:hypothetical protein